VGGGDRFDIAQNRAIGRAYLALLHRRYAKWPDAVSAYNWGTGNFDSWIWAGRPSRKLLPAIAMYSRRVLNESGLCVSARRNCTLHISGAVAPYGRIGYRGAGPASSSYLRVIRDWNTAERHWLDSPPAGIRPPNLCRAGRRCRF
jgi:hypothetical protein